MTRRGDLHGGRKAQQPALFVVDKRCSKCGEVKALAEFAARRSKCRACRAEENREYNRANAERRYEYNRVNAERQRQYAREYYRANTEKIRKYYDDNAEKRRAYSREYNRGRSVYLKDYYREYRKANPGVMKAITHRRRARKAGASGTYTAAALAARWAMFGGRCWMCGEPATVTDHVIPLAYGGTNWPANLRPACVSCNCAKGAKDWRQFVTRNLHGGQYGVRYADDARLSNVTAPTTERADARDARTSSGALGSPSDGSGGEP